MHLGKTDRGRRGQIIIHTIEHEWGALCREETVSFVSYSLVGLSALFAIPVGVFLLEVVVAIAFPGVKPPPVIGNDFRPMVAILVPAHNESAEVLPTIEDIKAQLRQGDRLVVVADNCSDDTAAIAQSAGAEVIVRDDPEHVGKGYALDWGLRYLSAAPPDIVVIIDADCRISEHAIDRLTTACAQTRRPIQALNLIRAPDKSAGRYQVAELACRVKNWVRPLGLSALNLPCQLMGTGMAFPWNVICSAELASGQIVEDLRLGLDLTLAGSPPVFCPHAVVTSHFPHSVEGAISQRMRWEHGHIGTIFTAPHLFYLGMVRGNLGLLMLTLDMAVPPLSLLGLLVTGILAIAGLAALFGASPASLCISSAALIGLMLAVLLSWLAYGRDVLPPSAILSFAPYVIGKLPLYLRALFHGRVSQWIRTDRKRPEGTLPSEPHRQADAYAWAETLASGGEPIRRHTISTSRPPGISATIDKASIDPAPSLVGRDDLSREVYGVLGIPIDRTDMATVVHAIKAAAGRTVPFLISTPNLNFLVNGLSDPEFRESLLLSDLCPPDGMPIIWIARLLGLPIKERVAGSDIFEALKFAGCSDSPMKVFLFGGAKNVAATAAERLNTESSGMICVGSLCPPFCSVDDLSADIFIDAINASRADFLAAALGAKKGQVWLKRNHHRLQIPIRAHLGATINFQAGMIKRAPLHLRKWGLEWLWRIKEEPQLWKRYWNDGWRLLRLLLTRVLPLAASIQWNRLRNAREERGLVIKNTHDRETVTIAFYGDATAQHVRKAICCVRAALTAQKSVVIDLSRVDVIDARFIGLLLMIMKVLNERQQHLEFTACPPRIERIFRLNGFEFLLSTEPKALRVDKASPC
jgi:N-acetylglucosaminyldiphosphoundecaprenol N-acetyl-beta-D-mannosaminyltransferase